MSQLFMNRTTLVALYVFDSLKITVHKSHLFESDYTSSALCFDLLKIIGS